MDLYTHPGKMGDLLWALSTARSHAGGRRFDLAVSTYCLPLVPLLQAQDYIMSAYVLDGWQVKFESPVTPPKPPWYSSMYTKVYHLGMLDWPSPTLIQHYPNHMMEIYGEKVTPDFNTPWLKVDKGPKSGGILLSFSDEWAELKAGWALALLEAFPNESLTLYTTPEARLFQEFDFPVNLLLCPTGVLGLARAMSAAKLVITCNSVGHPLASALGVRTLVVECSPPRQQPVFKAPMIKTNTYWDGINSYELIDHVRMLLGLL